MKLRYLLPAIAFFVMSAVGSAQAGPVVYHGSDIILGNLSIGQTGIISNSYSLTPFVNNVWGNIPSNSQITFTYTLTGAAFGTLLVDLASYDYYDADDNHYNGSAYSNSSGPSGSMGFFNESPSVPLVLATANLINPNSGVTRIQNFSGDYANFLSMITGLLASMGGKVEAYFEVSAVPLPAALPLFGLGIAGLAGIGIRKRKAAAAK